MRTKTAIAVKFNFPIRIDVPTLPNNKDQRRTQVKGELETLRVTALA